MKPAGATLTVTVAHVKGRTSEPGALEGKPGGPISSSRSPPDFSEVYKQNPT